MRIFILIILAGYLNTTCKSTGAIFVDKSQRWPLGYDGLIKVCWESIGYDIQKKAIEDKIHGTWAKYGDIHLQKGWANCNSDFSDIKIKFEDIPEEDVAGTCSPPQCVWDNETDKCKVPFELTRSISMELDIFDFTDIEILKAAVHEFGHAFGIGHEHDLDKIGKECKDEIEKQDWYTPTVVELVGRYSEYSIMHYGCSQITQFANAGLSCTDMATIRHLFGPRNSHIGKYCTVDYLGGDKWEDVDQDFVVGDPDWFSKEYYYNGTHVEEEPNYIGSTVPRKDSFKPIRMTMDYAYPCNVEAETCEGPMSEYPILYIGESLLRGTWETATTEVGAIARPFMWRNPFDLRFEGNPDDSKEVTVTLEDGKVYMIGTAEVSALTWVSAMSKKDYSNTGLDPSYGHFGNRPVERISYYDALLFCNMWSKKNGLKSVYSWPNINGGTDDPCPYEGVGVSRPTLLCDISIFDLDDVSIDFNSNGYRLLTVDEWKYLAKGDNNNELYFNPSDWDEYAWLDSERKHLSRAKKPNGFGLYDMIGNVWEWCHGQVTTSPSQIETAPIIGGGYGENTTEDDLHNLLGEWNIPKYADLADVGLRIIRRAPSIVPTIVTPLLLN